MSGRFLSLAFKGSGPFPEEPELSVDGGGKSLFFRRFMRLGVAV